MMIFKGSLIDIVSKVDDLAWDLWVYSEPFEKLNVNTQCTVIDVNIAELGTDGFTPLEAEKIGYQELISVQDLKAILRNLSLREINTGTKNTIEAINYYIDNDAYLP